MCVLPVAGLLARLVAGHLFFLGHLSLGLFLCLCRLCLGHLGLCPCLCCLVCLGLGLCLGRRRLGLCLCNGDTCKLHDRLHFVGACKTQVLCLETHPLAVRGLDDPSDGGGGISVERLLNDADHAVQCSSKLLLSEAGSQARDPVHSNPS